MFIDLKTDRRNALDSITTMLTDCGLATGDHPAAGLVCRALEELQAWPLLPEELAIVEKLLVAVVRRMIGLSPTAYWRAVAAVCREHVSFLDRVPLVPEDETFELTADPPLLTPNFTDDRKEV